MYACSLRECGHDAVGDGLDKRLLIDSWHARLGAAAGMLPSATLRRIGGGGSNARRSTPLAFQLSRKTSLAQMSQFSMSGEPRIAEAPLALQVQAARASWPR